MGPYIHDVSLHGGADDNPKPLVCNSHVQDHPCLLLSSFNCVPRKGKTFTNNHRRTWRPWSLLLVAPRLSRVTSSFLKRRPASFYCSPWTDLQYKVSSVKQRMLSCPSGWFSSGLSQNRSRASVLVVAVSAKAEKQRGGTRFCARKMSLTRARVADPVWHTALCKSHAAAFWSWFKRGRTHHKGHYDVFSDFFFEELPL